MPVPASGPLELRGDIALEVNGSATGTDVSLGALSNTAGFTEPDTMSEFYDFSMVSAPTVQTDAASSVTASGFTANGNATNDNGASITDRGFYVGTNSDYTQNTKTSVGGSGTGAFTLAKTGLVFNTTYYITAYATNSEGEGRGATITQNTSNASAPSVTTNSMDNVSFTSMRANGNVTADGGATVTERGFYFGTSSNYASNSKITAGSGTGSYSSQRNSISSSTTYYATAYAINAAGETRGSTVSAQTQTPATYSLIATYTQTYHQWDSPQSASWAHQQMSANASWSSNASAAYHHSSYGWSNYASYGNSWNGSSGRPSSNYAPVMTDKRYKRTDTTEYTEHRVYHYASMTAGTNPGYWPFSMIRGGDNTYPGGCTSGGNVGASGSGSSSELCDFCP